MSTESSRHEWVEAPLTTDLVRGALDLEQTAQGVLPHRLPAWARDQNTDPQFAMAEAQPSGVRLAFRTAATAVELDTRPTKRVYVGAPPRPDGVYELLVDGELAGSTTVPEGSTLTIDMTKGTAEHHVGPVGTARFHELPEGEKNLELWLPHDESTELVALRANAPLTPAPDRGRPVWLHHGSSISHGSNAATPTGIWPAVAARQADVDLINLGFGGSALLDPFVARTMRDTPADLISLKLGINLVNADVMRLRAFTPAVHGYLDTIREGHPHTPLLVVSPIHCPIHEDTPGPCAPDFSRMSEGRMGFLATGDPADVATGRLTLTTIRQELARIVATRAATDPHIHYLDGRELYGEEDFTHHPLPDDLHPDAPTHRSMGERFAGTVFRGAGPFAGRGGLRGQQT